MFCTPRCVQCDTEKTIRGRRLYNESEKCLKLIEQFESETGVEIDVEIKSAIYDWAK